MRIALLIPAAGLALALGTPAFAQSASTNGSAQKNGSTATMPHAGIQAMTQEKLRQQLEAAGFKNVKVIDAAYVVQAQTQDGNMVYMTINPPETLSGSSSSGNSSGTGSSSGGSSSGGSSSGSTSGSGNQ